MIDSFISNRTSQIAVQTEADKVQQAKQQALAIRKVSKALAQAGPNYALLQTVQSGKVQFRVISQDNNLALQTPPPSPGGRPAAPVGCGARRIVSVAVGGTLLQGLQ